MSIQVANLPALGQVAGRPRKEPLYDTEGLAAAAAAPPLTVTLFANPNAFNTPAIAVVKQLVRDTNVSTAGALGRAEHFLWYGVQHSIHPIGVNMTTLANVVVFELMDRARDQMGWQFNFGTTPYIQNQLSDIPSNRTRYVNTTHGASTVVSDVNGEGGRRHYDVTVGGQPQSITELERFSIQITTPVALGFAPPAGVDLFHTGILRGVRVRGITG